MTKNQKKGDDDKFIFYMIVACLRSWKDLLKIF